MQPRRLHAALMAMQPVLEEVSRSFIKRSPDFFEFK